MSGWNIFCSVVTAFLIWYLVWMIISIILCKVSNGNTTSTTFKWSRIFKGLSLLNWPFKQLDAHSCHVSKTSAISTSTIQGESILDESSLPDTSSKQAGGYRLRRNPWNSF